MRTPKQTKDERDSEKELLEYFLSQPNEFWDSRIDALTPDEYKKYEDKLDYFQEMSGTNSISLLHNIAKDLALKEITKKTAGRMIYFSLFREKLY